LYTGKKTNTEHGLGESVITMLTKALEHLCCEINRQFLQFTNASAEITTANIFVWNGSYRQKAYAKESQAGQRFETRIKSNVISKWHNLSSGWTIDLL
jgi:hypothetical protein